MLLFSRRYPDCLLNTISNMAKPCQPTIFALDLNTMTEENKYESAFSYAATAHRMVVKYEALISESLNSETGIDTDLLTDYAKVINSYCDALDLMDNYPQEQTQYEKVIKLLTSYGEEHPEQFNIAITTYIKYADVLFKQKKYKKSCEALKSAMSILVGNMDSISFTDVDINFINNQLNKA